MIISLAQCKIFLGFYFQFDNLFFHILLHCLGRFGYQTDDNIKVVNWRWRTMWYAKNKLFPKKDSVRRVTTEKCSRKIAMIKWSRCTYFHIFFTDLRDLVKTNCKLGKALHNQRCYGDQWMPCLFLRKNRIESKAPKTGLDFWRLTPQRKHLILYPKDSPLISYARCNVLVTVCISFCPGVGS